MEFSPEKKKETIKVADRHYQCLQNINKKLAKALKSLQAYKLSFQLYDIAN